MNELGLHGVQLLGRFIVASIFSALFAAQRMPMFSLFMALKAHLHTNSWFGKSLLSHFAELEVGNTNSRQIAIAGYNLLETP